MVAESATLLKMTGISKSFAGVKALDQVHLELNKGEVIGLLGENGAGKSTLMKILSGIYTPDTGEIWLENQKLSLRGPRHSQSAGISIIHQELNLLPHLTVAENIFIQSLPQKGIALDKKKLFQDAQQLLDELGFHIHPKTLVGELTVGAQQMVEIAKALSFQSKVIIMDEPTSAITEQETAKLFEIIRSLKAKGIATIYISHRMEEIYEICDRIVVLRDGCNAGEGLSADLKPEQIVRMLVGREMTQIFPQRKGRPGGEVVMEVKDFTRKGVFENISFRLHKGEILGFSGLMGSGRTELMESVFGMEPVTGGEFMVHGSRVNIRSTQDAIAKGFALVPEDRRKHGLIGHFTVIQNVTIATLKNISGFLQKINFKKEREIADRYIAQLRIKTPSGETVISNLSGGNQQKVIIAKWLESQPRILILDEPTRGIDIGAKAEIYHIIHELAAQGTAIILISSELPEVIGLSDRILVMAGGRITGEFHREEATPEKIMLCATRGGYT
ncbi:sugar ABC transporter ATP-binding protein [Paenibacillus sp. JMULE4]|nr:MULTISPECIES: sugar ABC transporter ATP-binding protein [Paenibacillus]NTZ17071.1 sugar ABC transporter ATP-binding protein [Paenibacillus sp. JMULE4]SDI07777.1 ribose transport system ATP-binding protein/inositol transport system ATP-binding protein [Paenibacillus naphthalenovorans]